MKPSLDTANRGFDDHLMAWVYIDFRKTPVPLDGGIFHLRRIEAFRRIAGAVHGGGDFDICVNRHIVPLEGVVNHAGLEAIVNSGVSIMSYVGRHS